MWLSMPLFYAGDGAGTYRPSRSNVRRRRISFKSKGANGYGLAHRTCQLLTQADIAALLMTAVTNGSQAVLHLVVSVDEKMIEVVNANKSEPRIFHVCKSVKGGRQSRGKNEHMNPAARFGSSHSEAGKQ